MGTKPKSPTVSIDPDYLETVSRILQYAIVKSDEFELSSEEIAYMKNLDARIDLLMIKRGLGEYTFRGRLPRIRQPLEAPPEGLSSLIRRQRDLEQS